METKVKFKSSQSQNSELIVFDPNLYFNSLLADIDQAENSIVLESYIFQVDQIGRKVIAALQSALQRGIKIRILIDGIGSSRDADLIVKQLESEDCLVRIFHPLPWDFAAYRRALIAEHSYNRLFYLLGAMNRRNHRKLCLIDNRIAWLGSFNITAAHFNHVLDNSAGNWHDTGLRLTGDLVLDLKANFEEVWQRKTASVTKRTTRFLSNHSIQTRIARNQRLITILKKAKKRIWITNAYFNPSIRLLSALKKSAKRGVDVRILVPSHSDVILFPLLSRTYYADLLNVGIKVFEYRSKLLHSKTMLIDHQVLVGSTNLNYRSFFHDLELDALLTSKESVLCLQQKYEQDLKNSVEITLDHWRNHSWLIKLIGGFSRFFRYWS